MDNPKQKQFQLNRLPKNSFEITVDIPWEEIKETENKVLALYGKETEIKGFRKGMAPLNLVKESFGQEKLLRQILEQILPLFFQKAVEEFKLKPIVSPKAELISAKENETWKVKYTSCEEPEVILGNYKEEITKIAKPEAKIWTPGKGEETKPEEKPEAKEEKINKVLNWLIANIKVEISDLLVEDEVNRKLSSLLEQTQKLGLTIDQYLASTGKSLETIKAEYTKQARENLAFEFILGKVADTENISINEEEIEKAVAKAESEEEKKTLQNQKYYLAILLRRQKTLDFLANL